MQTIHRDDKTHFMQPKMAQMLYDEVIRRDVYRMRSLAAGPVAAKVKTIVDVGANVGYFSMFASCLFPSARRIACEPDGWNFEMLSANMQGLGVECRRVALGSSGGHVEMVHDRISLSGCDRCRQSDAGVSSMLLSEMMETLRVEPEGLVVKMDCEGGEWWMTKDAGLKKWIDAMLFFTAEVHFFNGEKTGDWMSWANQAFAGMSVEGRRVVGNMEFTAARR